MNRPAPSSRGAAPDLPEVEAVAAIVHDAWMQAKLLAGVTSRLSETGEELMRPYADLSETAKALDRMTVLAVYGAISKARRAA